MRADVCFHVGPTLSSGGASYRSLRGDNAPVLAASALGVLLLWVCLSVANADEAPVLASYPCRTGLKNVSFSAPAPLLVSGTNPVRWSFKKPPVGETPNDMVMDAATGEIRWARPREGFFRILTCASNAAGEDYVEWVLGVVDCGAPDATVISSRHVDFVVPRRIANWIQRWHPLEHVDAGFEYMRDLVGQDFGWPMGGKQVIRYDSNAGGLGHSGNPVAAGPPFWSDFPAQGWELGVWTHEVGHNFAETLPGAKLLKDNWAGELLHGFVELVTVPLTRRAVREPAKFGLAGAAVTNYAAYVRWRDRETDRRYQPYAERLRQGGRAEGYKTEPSIVWAQICRVLCDEFGPEVLERTVRSLRQDGLPAEVYQKADTSLKKNTLLFCLLSSASGVDLRQRFNQWGFESDNSFYDALAPVVRRTLGQLPDEDRRGWKRCPLNGHYYRLTPWMTGWHEAERMAGRLDGHLATIRSAAEEDWLLSRFRIWGLWIGLSDEAQEGHWVWSSGEPLVYAGWNTGEPSGGLSRNFALFNHLRTKKAWVAYGPTLTWGIIEASGPKVDESL
jgi:hypothetical protein